MPVKRPDRSGGAKIPIPATPANANLSFSLKYFHQREPFLVAHLGEGYLETLLERLKNLSSLTMQEIRVSRAKALRSHAIDWTQTTEPNGFDHINATLREQLKDCWQFALTANEHGRIHGFIIGDVFYIVWLDHHHEVYR